jgi:hypothetical protein
MGRKRKVDLIEIQKLKKAGLCVSDIAKKIGCAKSSVSQGFKDLGLSGSQDVVLRVAGQLNNSKLNAMAKLEKICGVVEGELDRIGEDLKKSKGKARIDWQEIQLKHTAEIRKQLSLLLEISQALYRIEEVDAFKRVVLEELGKIAPEARDKVLSALKARRSQTNLGIGD